MQIVVYCNSRRFVCGCFLFVQIGISLSKLCCQAKASQTRHRLLFHGLIRLWLRNSGLRPSNSLATTANFISWNDAIASDGLLTPFPCCINLVTDKSQFIHTLSTRYPQNPVYKPQDIDSKKENFYYRQQYIVYKHCGTCYNIYESVCQSFSGKQILYDTT